MHCMGSFCPTIVFTGNVLQTMRDTIAKYVNNWRYKKEDIELAHVFEGWSGTVHGLSSSISLW